mgnify:CR=1 FL=1
MVESALQQLTVVAPWSILEHARATLQPAVHHGLTMVHPGTRQDHLSSLPSTVVAPWSSKEHARTTSAFWNTPLCYRCPLPTTPGPRQDHPAVCLHLRFTMDAPLSMPGPRQDHARTTLHSAIIRGAIAVHQGTREDRAAHTACLLPLSRSCRGSPKTARGPPLASEFVS